MPDEMVLDAPAEETAVDTSVETESTEGSEATETPTDEQQTTQDQLAPRGAVIDGNKLSEEAKATLEKIKAENPRLAGQIRTALFEADAMKRVFAGGIKEAREIAQFAQEVGGRDGFQAVKGELDEWHAFDQKFIAGDATVVADMVKNMPGSFLKLAPTVFEQYSQMHPDGFSQYVSSIFVSDLVNAGIPLQLERLQDFIGDNPKAQAVWQKLADYVNRVDGMARKKVEAPKFETAEKPNDLNDRETALTQREWSSEHNNVRASTFQAEFSRLSAGRKITDDQKQAITELFASRMGKVLSSLSGHKDKVDRFFASKDKNGYLTYMKSTYRQQIPKALASAFDAIVPAKPGPKGAAAGKPNGTAPTAGKPNAVAAPQGFVRVGQVPPAKSVRYGPGGTTKEMINQRRAILLDGRRVAW